MIKAKVSTDYKDIERIFAGGSIQKEILKVWSTEANAYVFEAWKVLEMEGPLPLTFNANGEALIDYRIYGNTEQAGTPTPENPIMPIGCGERTENLWNPNSRTNNQTGQLNWGVVLPAGTYTIKNDSNVIVYFRDGIDATTAFRFATPGETITKTATNELVAWCNSSQKAIMLNLGSTPLPYEPYGYKLPILSNSTVTNIYIGDTQLAEDEYVSYAEGKIYRKNPANYFDGYFELGSIDYTTGADTPSNTSIRTDFIELEPSNRFYIKWKTGNLYILPVSYDENKNYVRYLGAKALNPTFFDLGANEKYIRFYLYNTSTPPKEMMICKNADASYYDPQDPPETFPQIPTYKGTTVIDYDGEKHLLTSDGYELVDKNQNGFLLSGSTLRPEKMYIKYKGR